MQNLLGSPLPTDPRLHRMQGVAPHAFGRNGALLAASASYSDLTEARANHCTLIDKIIVNCHGRTGAVTYDTLTFRVTDGTTDYDIPILIPGETATAIQSKFVLDFNGSLCLPPGFKVQGATSDTAVGGTADFSVYPSVQHRYLHRNEAAAQGRATSWTNSTTDGQFWIAAAHPSATSRTAFTTVSAKAGYHVRIRGFFVRGHGASASNESMLIEFGDGATYRKCFRWYSKQINQGAVVSEFCNHVRVSGPSGYRLYYTCSKASAFSVFLWGDYVKASNDRTVDNTGVHSSFSGVSGDEFWCYREQVGAGSGGTQLCSVTHPGLAVVEGISASMITGGASDTIATGYDDGGIVGYLVTALAGAADQDLTLVADQLWVPHTPADTPVLFLGSTIAAGAATVWGRMVPRSGMDASVAGTLQGAAS